MKITLKIILYVLFLMINLGQIKLQAQQLPIFTQYRESQGIINPAAVSNSYLLYEHTTLFGASYRKQWQGLKGTPTTQYLRGEHLWDEGNIGLLAGGYLMNDKAGRIGFTGINGRIAIVISPDVEDSGISIGLHAAYVQYRVNLIGVNPRDEGDLAALESQNRFYPDVGAGIFAYTRLYGNWTDNDIVYTGLSIPQVLGLNLTLRDKNNNEFETQRIQHYYATVGYIKKLNDEYSFIELSTWFKYVVHAPINFDINIRYQIQKFFWIGGGWNSGSTLHLETGVILGENNNVRVGYSFDVPISNLKPHFSNSHEINATFSFGGNSWY